MKEWPPAYTADKIFRFLRAEWAELPKNRYSLEEEGCTIHVELLPGESIVVMKAGNYTGPSKKRYEGVSLYYMSIESGYGKEHLEGWYLINKFKKVGTSLYVYKFK